MCSPRKYYLGLSRRDVQWWLCHTDLTTSCPQAASSALHDSGLHGIKLLLLSSMAEDFTINLASGFWARESFIHASIGGLIGRLSFKTTLSRRIAIRNKIIVEMRCRAP